MDSNKYTNFCLDVSHLYPHLQVKGKMAIARTPRIARTGRTTARILSVSEGDTSPQHICCVCRKKVEATEKNLAYLRENARASY